jgi:hypothetical protein
MSEQLAVDNRHQAKRALRAELEQKAALIREELKVLNQRRDELSNQLESIQIVLKDVFRPVTTRTAYGTTVSELDYALDQLPDGRFRVALLCEFAENIQVDRRRLSKALSKKLREGDGKYVTKYYEIRVEEPSVGRRGRIYSKHSYG